VFPPAQRRVSGPAEVRGTTGSDKAADHDQAAEQVQPVGERVQPGESHVRGADLQRHDVVGEREQQRGGEQQQHDRAVHREQLVVLLRRQELHTRTRQLSPHEQGQHAADQEEPERRGEVHQADLLRVGGAQDPGQSAATLGGPSSPPVCR
jgi:hypothetical protein